MSFVFADLYLENNLDEVSFYKSNNEMLQNYKKTPEYAESLQITRVPEITKYIIDHYRYNNDKECIIFNISDIGQDNINELVAALENKGFSCFIDESDILTIH